MLRWMGQRRKEMPPHKGAQIMSQEAHGVADVQTIEDFGAASANASAANGGQRNGGEQGMFAVRRSVYLPRVALKTTLGDTQKEIKDKESDSVLGKSEHQGRSDQDQGYHQRDAGDDGVDVEADRWSENFYLRSDDRLRGVNPLFVDSYKLRRASRQSTPSGEKSSSSGYGGSNLYGSSTSDHQLYTEMKSKIDGVLEQNPHYVKSIQVAKRKNKSTHSSGSSGTLSTIPEGRIDFTIPRPIWPNRNQRTSTSNQEYDSLVDEAVLLYTSLSNHQETNKESPESIRTDFSVKDILLELLNNVNATIEGKGVLSPEEMLKRVNERIRDSIDALKHATEEEMRLLCINLRNSKKVDSVVRAFSHTSSSGNSSQSSPEWSNRIRTLSTDTEDIYHLPSSSSSGFSDCMFNKDGMTVINNANNLDVRQLPMFVHDDLASVPNGVRNAMIYGTLCRNNNHHCGGGGCSSKNQSMCHKTVVVSGGEKKVHDVGKCQQRHNGDNGVKQSLLRVDDEKPSVWEQYYGVNVAGGLDDKETHGDIKIDVNYVPKPTDVPVFPGGRPEADFTLDVPRSEMLSKRMKEDKKWRCRCRLLTSFLGLVFFLLSVMAVSLMLTRGRKMFGSMV